MENNNIVIIGGPNAGKTHFGGQLYGRLSSRNQSYKITSPPEDLTIFKEVLDNLNQGKSAGHTHVNEHKTLSLEIEDRKGQVLTFSFPDYGGEQIKTIVTEHRVNEIWKNQIIGSGAWMLFIRIADIFPVEDVSNRGIPDQNVLKQRNDQVQPMVLSQAAFYIELLQIFLFVKKNPLKRQIKTPKLTVILSCWDLLTQEEQKRKPIDVLNERIPALHGFIQTTWQTDAWQVMGLSSLEKTLSVDVPDKDFIMRGPEDIGYIITKDGKKESDLTLSISKFLE